MCNLHWCYTFCNGVTLELHCSQLNRIEYFSWLLLGKKIEYFVFLSHFTAVLTFIYISIRQYLKPFEFERGKKTKPNTSARVIQRFLSIHSLTKIIICIFIPCHRNQNRKSIVYSTVLHPTFPSCAACMSSDCVGQNIFNGMPERLVWIPRKYHRGIFHGISRESVA